jgi:hypothetical protein
MLAPNDEGATKMSETVTADRHRVELEYWEATIDEVDAAKFLDISVRTLSRVNELGIGPRRFALSPGRYGYTRRELAEWRHSRARKPTRENEDHQAA